MENLDITFSIHSGNKDKYNLVKVNKQIFDYNVAMPFKRELPSLVENRIDRNINSCIDLSEVDYMDSSSLAAVYAFRRLCRNVRKGDLYLVVKKDGAVERLLENSQTDSLFNIIHNINEL